MNSCDVWLAERTAPSFLAKTLPQLTTNPKTLWLSYSTKGSFASYKHNPIDWPSLSIITRALLRMLFFPFYNSTSFTGLQTPCLALSDPALWLLTAVSSLAATSSPFSVHFELTVSLWFKASEHGWFMKCLEPKFCWWSNESGKFPHKAHQGKGIFLGSLRFSIIRRQRMKHWEYPYRPRTQCAFALTRKISMQCSR